MKQKYDLSGNIFSDKYLNLRKQQIKTDSSGKKKCCWKLGKSLHMIKKKSDWSDTFSAPFYLDEKINEQRDTCMSFHCCGLGIMIMGGGLTIIALLLYISIKN